ncbi:GH25 family lysozyme [Nocardia sp. NBC_00511]|uniref:GH25 family lysozyme n=1 Tax=Nocardia sp. NBC_00511 TaxID=2903591 RepID=UPI0030E5B0B8
MTIYGIDISNNNGGDIDLSLVKAEGFEFVFCKVSEGDGFLDWTWPHYRDAAQAAGLAVAGYHYLRGDSDVNAQAQVFCSNLGEMPAMVDFEANSGGMDTFWAFVRACNSRGVEISLSYIPRWYWQNIGRPDLSQVPGLIQSSYVSGRGGAASVMYPGDDSTFWNGFGGKTVDLLQFTDAAQVAGHLLDANAFQGTRFELDVLLGTIPFPNSGGLMALTDDEQQELLDNTRYIRGQLSPWPQLGHNDQGQPLTLVDAVAELKAWLQPKEQA